MIGTYPYIDWYTCRTSSANVLSLTFLVSTAVIGSLGYQLVYLLPGLCWGGGWHLLTVLIYYSGHLDTVKNNFGVYTNTSPSTCIYFTQRVFPTLPLSWLDILRLRYWMNIPCIQHVTLYAVTACIYSSKPLIVDPPRYKQYNRPLYKGCFSSSQIVSFKIPYSSNTFLTSEKRTMSLQRTAEFAQCMCPLLL